MGEATESFCFHTHNPIGSSGERRREIITSIAANVLYDLHYTTAVDPKNGDNEARIAIDTHFRDDESLRVRAMYTIVRMRKKSLRHAIAFRINSLRLHAKFLIAVYSHFLFNKICFSSDLEPSLWTMTVHIAGKAIFPSRIIRFSPPDDVIVDRIATCLLIGEQFGLQHIERNTIVASDIHPLRNTKNSASPVLSAKPHYERIGERLWSPPSTETALSGRTSESAAAFRTHERLHERTRTRQRIKILLGPLSPTWLTLTLRKPGLSSRHGDKRTTLSLP